MKVEFKVNNEKRYYSPINYNVNFEKNYFDSNNFRIAFYINHNIVYAYYLGKYYIGMILGKNLDEVDILNEIKAQCSDPYKVNEKEIELD